MTAPPAPTTLPAVHGTRGATAVAGPLVVEFVGLPGAGKSTVARALLDRGELDGWRAIVTVGARALTTWRVDVPPARGLARVVRTARFARFLARRRGLVRAVARYGLSVRPRSIERLGFVWSILGYAFQLERHRVRPVDVVVLDQATLQAVWSVAVRGCEPPPALLRRMLAELLGLAGGEGGRWAVVHFDLRPDAALERIARRPTNTSRFDRMTAEEAMALLPGLRQHLDLVVDVVTAAGVPCLRVDAQQPMEATIAAIGAFASSAAPPRTDSRGSTTVASRDGAGGRDG